LPGGPLQRFLDGEQVQAAMTYTCPALHAAVSVHLDSGWSITLMWLSSWNCCGDSQLHTHVVCSA